MDGALFDPIPFAVETRVGERNTAAGIENRITCQLLDQQGQPISVTELDIDITPNQGFEFTDTGVVGKSAREYLVKCFAREYGLVDETPALWTVVPGEPVVSVASVSDVEGAPLQEMPSGERAVVDCEAFDAYGNPITNVPLTEAITPAGIAVERVGFAWRVSAAGRYSASCLHPNIEDPRTAEFDVLAPPPSGLTIALNPDQPIYRVGQVVEVIPASTDADGNVVPNIGVSISADEGLTPFGSRRFRLDELGRFNVYAELTGETATGEPLSASREVVVDFAGPGIRCTNPDTGDLISISEGEQLSLQGQASDLSGLTSLSVDNVNTPFDAEGRFQASVSPEWGLNLHNINATSVDGDNSTFCSYLAAEEFLGERDWLGGALELFLGQGVIDDGGSDSPLSSLGDVLRRVVNSPGLRDNVHSTMLAQNPIVPTECRARFLGFCVLRVGADYRDFSIAQNNELTLTLLQDALRVRVALRDVTIVGKLKGTLSNTGRISTPSVVIDITFNAALGAGNRPNISVQSLNEVTVDPLSSNFSGWLTGWVLELVFDRFESQIRGTITNTIRSFLETQLDNTLTGLFSDVDLGELASGVSVVSPSGQNITLQLLSRLDRLEFSPQGVTLSLGTRVDGPNRMPNAFIATPLLPTPPSPYPNNDTISGLLKLSVINQAMVALWRAGFFEARQGVGGLGANLAEGVNVGLSMAYPPVVQGVNGQSAVKISLGPISLAVTYPGFFDEPFNLQAAAVLGASVSLRGDDELSFDGVSVERLALSLGAGLPALARARLEEVTREVLTRLIDESLNGAFNSLPLPQLSVPPGLEDFNLPPTIRLGLRDVQLSGERGLWRLNGGFGE
jgi:hypothetical protein